MYEVPSEIGFTLALISIIIILVKVLVLILPEMLNGIGSFKNGQ